MTLFLRNSKNQTVVDIEINFTKNGQDLHSVVVIETYSKLLLENLNRSEEVIKDFTEISQLRGWFWEVYMEMTAEPSQKDCVEKVKAILIALADKYKLDYIVD
jgi:hypothetical protein